MTPLDNDALRAATGNVADDRPLVGFLYELLRDHLPAAEVEALVRSNEKISPADDVRYCNGHLARYAQLLADRLAAGGGGS